jgi:ABC-type lipoprotein export system ATPase subunit
MIAGQTDRGLALLAAHCAALDPDTPTAAERLEQELGHELAHKLVFALSGGSRRRVPPARALRARAVFAA